ncbi:hypothetical protein BGZ52_002293, partial [Haplosporangium bisporale]
MPISKYNDRSRTGDDSSSVVSEKPILLQGGRLSFNFMSKWFFLWVIPLIRRTRSDPDFDPDSIKLQREESARVAGQRLGDYWRQEELDYKN